MIWKLQRSNWAWIYLGSYSTSWCEMPSGKHSENWRRENWSYQPCLNPRLPVPRTHTFGTRGNGIAMPTLQRQLPLQPLCSATRLKQVLNEHITCFVFAISQIMSQHCQWECQLIYSKMVAGNMLTVKQQGLLGASAWLYIPAFSQWLARMQQFIKLRYFILSQEQERW